MRKNTVKHRLKHGEVIFSGWLHIPSTWSAELMASCGWDAVTVDLQHGLMGIETAIQMFQAISTSDAMPLARCSWNEPSSIMRLLDGGSYGVICPMINSREECQRFIDACLYPPLGSRSYGPTRARVYGGLDYGDHANDELLTLAMIETKEAANCIDDILSVDGLDGIFVGSGDLKLSITGKTGHSKQSVIFDKTIAKIAEACENHNKIPGIWSADANAASDAIKKGYRFLAISSDSMMLNAKAVSLVNELQKLR